MITQTQTRQQTSITTTSMTKKRRFAVLDHKVATATRCLFVCADCGGLAEALGSPRQPHVDLTSREDCAPLDTQADDASMHSDEEEAARMSWEYEWEYQPPEADREKEVNAAIEMTSNHNQEEEVNTAIEMTSNHNEDEDEAEVTDENIHID